MYRKFLSNSIVSIRGGCVKIDAASFFTTFIKKIKQNPDFLKQGLCHVRKILYLSDIITNKCIQNYIQNLIITIGCS